MSRSSAVFGGGTCARRGRLVIPLVRALTVGAALQAGPADCAGPEPARLARFETSLEELRQQLKIPGLSAAIVCEGRLAWARGFGHADVKRGLGVAPETPFHLASVTKPFAAVVVLGLAEEGVLNLDDPVSEYGLDYESAGVIRVRHLLSHTSGGEPGTEFRYDSERFADLGWVLARASGRSFRELLVQRVLGPLRLENTAPCPMSMGDGVLSPFRTWLTPRNARVYHRLARPYALDRSFAIGEGSYPVLFSPASGLLSSVSDLARFDIALDDGRLLSESARAQMFTPAVAPAGRELPYGLGWFSQTHAGTRLVWHYGWNPPTASALYLKLPDEGLTFIALANTDALSRPFDLGRDDTSVLDSAAALRFYETFVLEPRRGRTLPQIDWEADEERIVASLRSAEEDGLRELRERELLSYRRLFHAVGREDRVRRLEAVHARLSGTSSPGPGRDLPPLGEHLLPWTTVPLFGMGHVTALAWFLLVIASTLGTGMARISRRWLRPRSRAREMKEESRGRLTTVLAMAAVVTGTALYAALLARWPQDGPVTWSGGGPLARGLLGMAAASGGLAAVVLIRAVASWGARTGSGIARVTGLGAASGVCAGAWALLDLVGWL
jgi:CubicO group peptidase (beta-lactamase class C family)